MQLNKVNTLAIIGDRNTCKTNLMFYIMSKYSGDRDKYLFGYPVGVDGYKKINTLNELSEICSAVIGVDEIQRLIPFYQKRTNDTLLELLSTMVHNDDTFIFSTPLSQFITKALDGFIDGFCYTKMKDLGVLKNGSKAKRRLMEFRNPIINKWSLNLEKGEYLEIVDGNDIGEDGVKTFPDMKVGKDWKNKNAKKIPTKTLKNILKETPNESAKVEVM